ncbi:hypothetical protein HIM_02114 [Hirsutella minnesotensis 3608]|nr:hypothetical protein HIM_02114 [Hirsutella minnesotensis 3608]
MPRPARKRPAQVAPPATRSMDAFTRVSKGQTQLKSVAGKAAVIVTDAVTTRKRKADAAEHDASPLVSRRTVSFPPSSDEDDLAVAPSKRACRRPETQSKPPAAVKPATKGKRLARPAPSKAQTAHRATESTIIGKSRDSGKFKQPKIEVLLRQQAQKTKEESIDDSLPPHLLDLVRLNKAFLKTIALQIAHGGSNAPIDFRAISPNISRAWKKRQVTVEDIRRCIAIQAYSPHDDVKSPLIVSDYGHGKVCIELAPGLNGASINQDRLNKQFRENLTAFCAGKATDDMADVGITLESLSLSDLPQAAITNMGSSTSVNPLLAKGQRALSELKSGLAAKQQEMEAKKQPTASNPLFNPDGSKMSLLDRLRLKQLAKANDPLPPSGPELQRRAALNRVADVAATISMLSLSNSMSLPRQAFTMAVMAEKLKDSLRTPISKEEGMACVRLIATEIAPQWLKIVTIGGRDNVVVQRLSQPVDRVIQERVQKLLSA